MGQYVVKTEASPSIHIGAVLLGVSTGMELLECTHHAAQLFRDVLQADVQF